VSFRENHWRGLADHHTVAFTDVVTHAVKPDYLHHSSGRHPPPPPAVLACLPDGSVESTIWVKSVRAATSVGDGESSLVVGGALDLVEERDGEVFGGDLRSGR
jgi:hypothetical protein